MLDTAVRGRRLAATAFRLAGRARIHGIVAPTILALSMVVVAVVSAFLAI